ncbi:MAG: hypothetical protein JWQ52_1795 [Phenylobacterium sp.]|jgi:hypothetical protein|nr:hypothetical protein [Phenylobacterium sp.]
MPEVIVRKRLAKRSGDWKFKVSRWFYRNRPQVAVLAAFAIACVAGLVLAAAGLGSLGGRPADTEASAPTQ